ncbi:PLP-dependent aminotransferase family protein [Saccharomonospora sp. NPDC006951]
MAQMWSSSGPDVHFDWDPGTGRRGLADAIRDAIRKGRLPHGAVLPSTRALASDLGIARGTVSRIYADLTAEGYVHSRQGAPTTVAADVPSPSPPPRARSGPGAPRWDLRPGQPDLSAFPRDDWASATRRVLQHTPASLFGYGDRLGVARLRESLAVYLARSRGVVADPQRIVVCGGFSHAVSLLTTALRELGETEIAFENPSLYRFRDIAKAGGARIIPVPVDGDGIDVSAVDSPAVVVTPAHHFPLGVTLAPERRTALAKWASATGAFVLEDDYDGEFRFDRTPVGALQTLAPERIAYAGTVSKTLAPGLRLGWLVLPRVLVEPVKAALEWQGFRTPVIEQLTFAELLDSGAYGRHIRRRRAGYRKRRDLLLSTFPDAVAKHDIPAGLQLLLRLPPSGPREEDVIATAARHSLGLEALGPHWASRGDNPQGIVVGYTTPPEHAYAGALSALRTVLAESSRSR